MPEGAAPPPPGVVPNFARPEDVLHTVNLVSQILSLVLVTAFMMLRLYAKTIVSPPFYLDDWFAMVAWILSSSYAATALVMGTHGGGYHIWEISREDLIGFYKLTSFLGLYADTITYGPTSFFTKVSLILMVIRVFATSRRTGIAGYVIILMLLGYYLPVLIIKAQICHPVAGYWDSSIVSTCLNQRAIFIADTTMSAVSDAAVLCLPIPMAMALRMTWQKRLKVIAMLSAGGAATAFSIVRMVLVLQLQGSTDDPVDFIRFNLLGTAEISIGVICGCFPAVNILMRRRKPTPNSSHHSSSSGGGLKFLWGSKLKTQNLTTQPPIYSSAFPLTTLGSTRDDDLITPAPDGGTDLELGAAGEGTGGGTVARRDRRDQNSHYYYHQQPQQGDQSSGGWNPHWQRSPHSPEQPWTPTSPFARRGSEEYIFPIERRLNLAQICVGRQQPQQKQQRGDSSYDAARTEVRPSAARPVLRLDTGIDAWYHKVTRSTFAGPQSPDWAREGVEESGRIRGIERR